MGGANAERAREAAPVAEAAILWRRLDRPGHDACRLLVVDGAPRLSGTTVFRERDAIVQLAYEVVCDAGWVARSVRVRGVRGDTPVDLVVERQPPEAGDRTGAGLWLLDGVPQPAVADCVDVDLAFTPATNLAHLRRLALRPGQAGDAPAAWLDLDARALRRLPQRYERRGATSYGYEAPTEGFATLLEVQPCGFVRRYPGLWEAEE